MSEKQPAIGRPKETFNRGRSTAAAPPRIAGWLRLPMLCLALLWTASVSVIAGSARAESSVSNAAAAELLFQEAVALTDAGNYAPACEKFAASQELDPTIGTMLHLADCYEQVGKVASAWSLFRVAEGQARSKQQVDRAEIAAQRAQRLTDQLSFVTLVVSEPQAPDLKLTLGDKPVPPAAWGTRVPIDPGTSMLNASAPGHKDWSQQVTIEPANETSVTVPPLRALPKPAPTAALPASVSPAAESSDGSNHFAWIVGGAGVLALGAGSVMGYRALALNRESKDECRGADQNICSPDGVEMREDAGKFADMASITLGAGALLVATGAVMLFTFDTSDDDPAKDASSTESEEVAFGLQPLADGAAIRLEGVW